MPVREPSSRCGALVIDSMPPATTMSAEPALIASWPSITAFMPEPQTLLMVVAPVATGMPARDRRLARGRLAEAGRQHAAHDHFATRPRRATPDCASAALMAVAPRVVAGTPVNWPSRAPSGGALGADDDDGRH